MKTKTITALISGILLFAACKKENTAISNTSDASAAQALSAEANELASARAVRIGTQVWMKKDLTTSYYRNGDKIPEVKDPTKWSKLTTGAWCWYNNDPRYGKLYNWYAVNDPRGLAPIGWHVPSDAEWTTLTNYLGGEYVAGGKMKETGTTHWEVPNTDATNSSGFTGLPGGYRYPESAFSGIGRYGYWWSATENSPDIAWYRYLSYNDGSIYRGHNSKDFGFSVRCIKD